MMIKTALLFSLLALALAARAQTQTPLERMYEVYNSSSTSMPRKHVLEHRIERRELVESRRRGAGASSGYGVAGVLKRLPVPPAAKKALTKEGGGLVKRLDRAAVLIPPAAPPRDLEITVAQPASLDEGTRQSKQAEARLSPASLPVAFGPEGTVFNAAVTITLPYDAGVVRAQALRESALKVHYWNPRLGLWEDLPSIVDTAARTVSAQVLHFSVYQVLGAGGGIGVAAADTAFGFKAAYAFPNPARGQSTVAIRVQPGPADSVEVRVYDLSGRKVHSSSDFRSLGAFDDGNGLGAQFTYEHVWDVSGIGSGVYTYAVVARKAGEADIRKTGKVGIVK
jgi:hypothetical protein